MTIYQHFRPDEREFIDAVLNWKDYVEQSYAPKLTDFLDPREQQIVQKIMGNTSEIKVEFFGGIDTSERKRALIYPDYYQFDQDDFEVTLFHVVYNQKFNNITHPQVLGTLMSLGLIRSKFGDILAKEGQIQFFCTKEVSSYVQMQFTTVGKAGVTLEECSLAAAIKTEEHWNEHSVTVSSLRLDAVISSIYNVSRQKSQLLITQGLVKVNWAGIEETAFQCEEQDVFSVRGYGRAILKSIEGKTKKDKWRLLIGRQN